MVKHKGYRYPVDDSKANSLVGNLSFPIVVLDATIVHNLKIGVKLGLISPAKSAKTVSIMLDLPLEFTFPPTSLLDIATHINAYYARR